MVLLFTAILEERESVGKLEGWQLDLSSVFFFFIEAMKRNSFLLLPSKQRLHKLRFLQKLGCQKLCLDQARLSGLVNKQVVVSLPWVVSCVYLLATKHQQNYIFFKNTNKVRAQIIWPKKSINGDKSEYATKHRKIWNWLRMREEWAK